MSIEKKQSTLLRNFFFSEKTQKAFAFHFIEKRDSLLQALKGQGKQAKIQIQWNISSLRQEQTWGSGSGP
jgi:hypothetical protein